MQDTGDAPEQLQSHLSCNTEENADEWFPKVNICVLFPNVFTSQEVIK